MELFQAIIAFIYLAFYGLSITGQFLLEHPGSHHIVSQVKYNKHGSIGAMLVHLLVLVPLGLFSMPIEYLIMAIIFWTMAIMENHYNHQRNIPMPYEGKRYACRSLCWLFILFKGGLFF